MNNKIINVAFCFDENVWMQAGVTITSLLCSSTGNCAYNIYCVVSKSVNQTIQNALVSLIKKYSEQSRIKFITVTNQLDNVETKKRSTFYRFLLLELLKELDEIIYFDTDIIFNCDLQELDLINLDKYYVAGVKDCHKNRSNFKNKIWEKYGLYEVSDRGEYIFVGVLVMNLKKIREDALDKKWLSLTSIRFHFHDQDIINLTCVGKVLLLDNKYNFTGDESQILHFSGNAKPWNAYDGKLKYAEIWWYYAYKTPFSAYFLKDTMKDQYERIFKILPTWLARFFCWFIFDRDSRHRFMAKYVNIKRNN